VTDSGEDSIRSRCTRFVLGGAVLANLFSAFGLFPQLDLRQIVVAIISCRYFHCSLSLVPQQKRCAATGPRCARYDSTPVMFAYGYVHYYHYKKARKDLRSMRTFRNWCWNPLEFASSGSHSRPLYTTRCQLYTLAGTELRFHD